ncbi:2-dehydropantoate 2-reductase [Rugamonas sp. CCM 8940]|uniref:2-dehydropantoate 2-reductase n=1 Tax=Rugamonas sp. CCM 8940 TaxID=2765359 RepID=UPI00351BFA00
MVGAGAIGGLLAVKLAQSGHELSVVVRGANLAAVREHGMVLRQQDGSESRALLRASDNIAELGPQDVVILAMKAHQLPPVAAQIPALLGPDTLIVTAQNGVPWWYFHKHGGPHEGQRVESVDPGGVVSAALDVGRVIGCIVYPACEMAAPGVVQHIEGNRFSLGELDGQSTPRIQALAEAMRAAGFKTPISADIRSELWVKLWGNLSFNPISALSHATLADICAFAPTRELAANMMREAQSVGERLGVTFKVSLERRIDGAAAVGQHKTSMLQDLESGRPIELAALVGSVLEMGRLTDTPTPTIAAVHALAALLARSVQERGGSLRIASAAR